MAKLALRTIVKRGRAKAKMPLIYVNIGHPTVPQFALAKIRIKAGGYQYLQWREGVRIRSYYLGRKQSR